MARAKISETECRHWAAEYRAKFSETLFNNTLDSLRHLFNLAIERGFIARNPAAGVEKVRVPQKKLELPSRNQFQAIVAEVRGAESGHSAGNGDLIEFLAYSGLRATEASLVRWQDIDLERSRI
jgi:integrase